MGKYYASFSLLVLMDENCDKWLNKDYTWLRTEAGNKVVWRFYQKQYKKTYITLIKTMCSYALEA